MELEFLGTGAGVPAKHRNVSGMALKLLDERNAIWLFDCGEGTQMQILKTTIKPRKVEKVFITHLHGDHIFGLPGFLSSRSFQGGTEPIDIYGPEGIERFVKTCLQTSKTKLGYQINFHEIKEGLIFQDNQFSVYCGLLEHGIDSYGFRIEEHDHEGALQVDRLIELGIPAGPLFGKLKNGEKITLPDGRMIDGKDFLGQKKKGRVVTILGDTRKTAKTVELAQKADLLVHESTFNKDESKMARNYFHSTTHQAAEAAKAAQVKELVLTHISARYLAKEAAELLKEAQEIFPNTKLAKDFDIYPIPLENGAE